MGKSKKNQRPLTNRKQKPLSPELSKQLQSAYAFHQKNELDRARAIYQTILAEHPKHAETNFLLGLLVFHHGEQVLSEELITKSVSLRPTEIRYLMGLGILFLRTGQASKATDIFKKAVNIAPKEVEPLYNLGTSLSAQTLFHEAESCLEKALKLKPDHQGCLNNMGNVQLGLCNIEAANSFFLRAFAQCPETLNTLSNTLLTYNYFETLNPQQLLEKHTEAAGHFPGQQQTLRYTRKSGQKIRVGYISADFKTHSVAYFLLPLLKAHDRQLFEIYCFYNGDKVDQTTLQFQSLSDHWEACNALSDEALRQQIIRYEIDILIDLSGHTSNNRIAVFSKRAAPVQISWLGYPHSTGIPEMDFRIVDNLTDPYPEHDALSTEKLLRLPSGFLCYEGREDIPYQTAPPCLENGFVTFGSFNNLAKVNQSVIHAWSQILIALPDAKLIVKSKQLSEASVKQRYLDYFIKLGISADRISFLQMLPATEDHLSIYNQIDIALDTFPYNGTTTTCEAMWMGVPTITFPGNRHAARVGASLMQHAGFDELISKDLDDYVSQAINLANQPGQLTTFRSNMRERMQQSDLCNARQFATQFEAAIKQSLSWRKRVGDK